VETAAAAILKIIAAPAAIMAVSLSGLTEAVGQRERIPEERVVICYIYDTKNSGKDQLGCD